MLVVHTDRLPQPYQSEVVNSTLGFEFLVHDDLGHPVHGAILKVAQQRSRVHEQVRFVFIHHATRRSEDVSWRDDCAVPGFLLPRASDRR